MWVIGDLICHDDKGSKDWDIYFSLMDEYIILFDMKNLV